MACALYGWRRDAGANPARECVVGPPAAQPHGAVGNRAHAMHPYKETRKVSPFPPLRQGEGGRGG